MDSLWIYHVKAGVSLAAFLMIYRLFIHQETHFGWSRFFLLLSILVSLMLPAIQWTFPILGKIVLQSALLRNPLMPAPVQIVHGDLAAMPAAVESGMDWKHMLRIVYLAGVAFWSIRFLFHMGCLLRLIRRHGIHKAPGYYLVWTDHEYSPFSFLNIIFINRKYLTDKSFQRVIAHERVHIQQGHTVDLFLAELLIIFQWMNPFVWPYKRYLKETHEFLADAGVIAQGCDTAAYQMLIVEQAVGIPLFGFSNSFHHTQVKRRIQMMTRKHSKSWTRLKGLLLIPVTAMFIILFAVPRSIRAAVNAEPLPVGYADSLTDSLKMIQEKESEFKRQQKITEQNALLMEIRKQKGEQAVIDQTLMQKKHIQEMEEKQNALKKVIFKLKQEQELLAEKAASNQNQDDLKRISEKENEINAKIARMEKEAITLELRKKNADLESSLTDEDEYPPEVYENRLKSHTILIEKLKDELQSLNRKKETILETGQDTEKIDLKIEYVKQEIQINEKKMQQLKTRLQKMN